MFFFSFLPIALFLQIGKSAHKPRLEVGVVLPHSYKYLVYNFYILLYEYAFVSPWEPGQPIPVGLFKLDSCLEYI